ncbi:MAG: hypothetical protein KGI51_05645 [Rhodospirillales bacterium]|nr:hypothetical protein [Rhodospirillales bacterium]
MTIDSYAKEWKQIKTNFEKATGKKKPSEKFMGVFDKASGLTPAATAFDKTLDGDDKNAAEKALGKFHDVADTYTTTLAKAAAGESDKTVIAEVKVMIGEIDNMLKQADAAAKKVGQIKHCNNLNDFAALMKNKSLGPRVTAYANRTHNTENVDFLLAMVKQDYSKDTYDTYVKDGAKQEINIDATLRKKFDPNNLRGAPWGQASNEILKLFNDNIVDKLNAGK